MYYNSDQVMNGIMKYAEQEVINKLPVMGKWVLGAGMGLAMDKTRDIIIDLQNNSIVKMLGLMDENGNIEVDRMIEAMKQSASKYGKAYIEVPLLGSLSFNSEDIETLRNYIERS